MSKATEPPHILVVEDDEIMAALTTEMLGSEGRVDWAPNAEQAIKPSDPPTGT